MKPSNRDLLVLVKDESLSDEAMEKELNCLNRMLFNFETIDNYCTAHEVIDMNRYKVVSQPKVIRQVINQKQLKPFVFVCNKN